MGVYLNELTASRAEKQGSGVLDRQKTTRPASPTSVRMTPFFCEELIMTALLNDYQTIASLPWAWR